MQVGGYGRSSVGEDIKNKMAESHWRDAQAGYSNDRTLRQRQALEGLGGDFQEKLGQVRGKYKGKKDNILALLDSGLRNSQRMGAIGAQGMGMSDDISRERAALGERSAINEGMKGQEQAQLLRSLLNSDMMKPGDDGMGDYDSAEEYLLESLMKKNSGLEDSIWSKYANLKKMKKNKKFSLLDILNNRGTAE